MSVKMFKWIAVIILAVSAVVVVGIITMRNSSNSEHTQIMTTDDLPQEIVNCLDDILIPYFGLKESGRRNCQTLPDVEIKQCNIKVHEEVKKTDDVLKCLGDTRKLPYTQDTFAHSYINNAVLKDRYTEIPEKMRECLDSMKSLAQKDFLANKDCELLISSDEPNQGISNEHTNIPYKECLEKRDDVFASPQSSKCVKIWQPQRDQQDMFMAYFHTKVVFNL